MKWQYNGRWDADTKAHLALIQRILNRAGFDGTRASLQEAQRQGLLDSTAIPDLAPILDWFQQQDQQQQGERP